MKNRHWPHYFDIDHWRQTKKASSMLTLFEVTSMPRRKSELEGKTLLSVHAVVRGQLSVGVTTFDGNDGAEGS